MSRKEKKEWVEVSGGKGASCYARKCKAKAERSAQDPNDRDQTRAWEREPQTPTEGSPRRVLPSGFETKRRKHRVATERVRPPEVAGQGSAREGLQQRKERRSN